MNPAKLLLIAGGAYLLWRYTSATVPASQTQAAPTPGANSQPGAPLLPAVSTDELARKAANGDAAAIAAADASGLKLNADQWNWYRAAGGGSATTVDLFPEGDRGFLMLASEYQTARTAAGLSGLQRRGWA